MLEGSPMKKSRFTESQIVAILKEGEAGVAVAQLACKRDQRSNLLPGHHHRLDRPLQRNASARRAGKPATCAVSRALARGGNSNLELSTRGGKLTRCRPAMARRYSILYVPRTGDSISTSPRCRVCRTLARARPRSRIAHCEPRMVAHHGSWPFPAPVVRP